MARNQDKTNSFSIARYILFLILGLIFIAAGAWILTDHWRATTPDKTNSPDIVIANQ